MYRESIMDEVVELLKALTRGLTIPKYGANLPSPKGSTGIANCRCHHRYSASIDSLRDVSHTSISRLKEFFYLIPSI